METNNRRYVLAGMAAAVSLPLLGMPVRSAARSREVTFPSRPVTLRRELERQLGDGASLRVVRDWQVTFQAVAAGATVSGRQQMCEVDVPPPLQALGDIERKREVTGLFPMTLSAQGLITIWTDPEPVSIASAVRQASRAIEKSSLASADIRDAKGYFARIGKMAAQFVSKVPRDLFFPEAGQRRETRNLKLPDGMTGSYEVTIEADARASDGLLVSSERRIVTRIGDSSRLARERWTLLV